MPDFLWMRIDKSDRDKARRIKNRWNSFVALFGFILLSFIVSWVLISAKMKSTGDDSWGYLLWFVCFGGLPVSFGVLIGLYSYLLSGKLGNSLFGLIALPWGFLMVGPLLGYFFLYVTAKNKLKMINKIS